MASADEEVRKLLELGNAAGDDALDDDALLDKGVSKLVQIIHNRDIGAWVQLIGIQAREVGSISAFIDEFGEAIRQGADADGVGEKFLQNVSGQMILLTMILEAVNRSFEP